MEFFKYFRHSRDHFLTNVTSLLYLEDCLKKDTKDLIKNKLIHLNYTDVLISIIKESKDESFVNKPEEKLYNYCFQVSKLLALKCLLAFFSKSITIQYSFEVEFIQMLIDLPSNLIKLQQFNQTILQDASVKKEDNFPHEEQLPEVVLPSAVEIAIAILTNISKYNRDATWLMVKLGIIKILPDLLEYPDIYIATHAASLAASMLYSLKLKWNDDWYKVIQISLEVIHKATQQCLTAQSSPGEKQTKTELESTEGEQNNVAKSPKFSKLQIRRLINAIIMLLMNRIFHCHEANTCFRQSKGLSMILRVCKMNIKNFHISKSAAQLLKNFIEVSYHSEKSRLYQVPKAQDVQNSGIYGFGCEDNEDSSLSIITSSESSNEDGESFKNSEESEVILISGEKLPLRNDFEFCSTNELHSEHLARLVCGMLNSGLGGRIFIGVDSDGTIKGEKMDSTYKDEIRLGLDCITELIKPSIFNYDVSYLPVKDTSLIDGVYVCMITCSPLKDSIYDCNKGECFYRLDRVTEPLSLQAIWNIRIKDMEQKYSPQIIGLQQKLKELTGVENHKSNARLSLKNDYQESGEFILGEKLPFKNDHEFCAASDLNAEHLARLVCGMLNSGLGGSIFIGIDPDGTIEGEKMDYTYKDEIKRICISCMTELIKPSIFNYDLKYIPVKEMNSLIDSLYVVIITCSPLNDCICDCNNGECFCRMGRDNVSLSLQEIWKRRTIHMEQKYSQQIKCLKQKYEELKDH